MYRDILLLKQKGTNAIRIDKEAAVCDVEASHFFL